MLKLGAATNKLVLGVPLYGRTFLLPDDFESSSKKKPKLGMASTSVGFKGPITRESGFMGYNEVCKAIILVSPDTNKTITFRFV